MNNILQKIVIPFGMVLVGAFMMSAPAHAFLIDGFGDDQVEISAIGPSGDNPVTATSATILISDTDFVNAQRTLEVTRTGGGGRVDMEVREDKLFYSQGGGTNGFGLVDWSNFVPVAFGSTAKILISVLEADLALGGLTITLGSGGSTESQTVALPQVNFGDDPVTLMVGLAGFSAGLLANVDSAQLELDGRNVASLDVTIDFIEIPAPGVLGLLGLGLAGLAFTVRRRRDRNIAAV